MRKRIKDLTLLEIRKICTKYGKGGICCDCPLRMIKKRAWTIERSQCILVLGNYPEDEEKFINKKIKVET